MYEWIYCSASKFSWNFSRCYSYIILWTILMYDNISSVNSWGKLLSWLRFKNRQLTHENRNCTEDNLLDSLKIFSLAGNEKKNYWKYVNPVVKFLKKLHTYKFSFCYYLLQAIYPEKSCKIPTPPTTAQNIIIFKVQLRSFLCPNEHLIVWKYIVQYTYIWYKKNHFRFRTWQ